jgi:hypothetical protein
MSQWYILDKNNNVVETSDVEEWSKFFKSKRRFLFYNKNDKYEISTVFLGINYAYDDNLNQLVFESMVFEHNSRADLDLNRYSTYEEAKLGHIELCHKYEIYYLNPNNEKKIESINDIYDINDAQ